MSKLDFHGGRKEENWNAARSRQKKKKIRRKSAVLEATLAQLKLSWVEFELELG